MSDIRSHSTLTASGDSHPSQPYGAGTVIARSYELVSLIGRGGFGEVWLAHNWLLDNDVAIKIYVRADATDDKAAERLRAEARAAASLEHPAIVRVFDLGETSRGDPFLVMELLHGDNLEELLDRKGPFSPRRALRLLLPIVEGIASAHAKGLVHRDIKLANIVLTSDDGVRLQPKLVDFGLAKPTRTGSRTTLRGELVGTPEYMSPEQANGTAVDARSDVWSMCVAMYELMTGRVPFDGSTLFERLRAVREATPTPLEIGGAIDAALVAIVMKGLRKAPEERWVSMRALGIEMARWLQAHGETEDVCGTSIRTTWLDPRAMSLDPTPPPFPAWRSPSRRRRIALAAVLAALTVAAAVAAGAGYALRPARLAPSPPIEVLRDDPIVIMPIPNEPHAAPRETASVDGASRPTRILPRASKDTSSVF